MKKRYLPEFMMYAGTLTILLAIGIGQTEASTPKTSKNTNTEFMVPEIVTDYVHIYKPQPDIYTDRDTKNYKHGQICYEWQTNDHSFAKDRNGRWHCFGITGAEDVLDDDTHEGGVGAFHAIAPVGTLEEAFRVESWVDQPKLGFNGAVYIEKIQDTYHMINSSFGHISSKDLYTWKDEGRLQITKAKNKDTRDPNVLYHEGTYYLVNCTDRTVNLVTSTDFVHWSDPIDIFEAPEESWQCESPSLIFNNGKFYLFWCLWDSSPTRDQLPVLYKGHTPWAYDYRTFVYASDIPTDFTNREPITMIKGHAPEIFQDEKGNWFISSTDYPYRGVSLARLEWKPFKK